MLKLIINICKGILLIIYNTLFFNSLTFPGHTIVSYITFTLISIIFILKIFEENL